MTDDYRVYGNWGLLLGVYSYLQSAKTIEIQKNQNSNVLSDAVLVEKAGSTMYDEVAKELELMERYNINVLGGILAE